MYNLNLLNGLLQLCILDESKTRNCLKAILNLKQYLILLIRTKTPLGNILGLFPVRTQKQIEDSD